MSETNRDFLVTEEELAGLEGADAQFEGDAEGAFEEESDYEPEGSTPRNRSFSPLPDRTGATLSPLGVSAEEVARAAAQALYDRKIEDILVLDLTMLSDVCDFFVIGTGLNNRMVDSAVDEVEEQVANACGEKPFSIEGRDLRTWILMDYGSVVVHVFTPEARDYYRLERLWGDAPLLELELL